MTDISTRTSTCWLWFYCHWICGRPRCLSNLITRGEGGRIWGNCQLPQKGKSKKIRLCELKSLHPQKCYSSLKDGSCLGHSPMRPEMLTTNDKLTASVPVFGEPSSVKGELRIQPRQLRQRQVGPRTCQGGLRVRPEGIHQPSMPMMAKSGTRVNDWKAAH